MRLITWILIFTGLWMWHFKAQARIAYTVTCPKCDYKVRLGSGGTKGNPTDPPSVYFCKNEKKLMSVRPSQIKNGMITNGECSSKLIRFNPLKKGQDCPVCGGKIVISDRIRAC